MNIYWLISVCLKVASVHIPFLQIYGKPCILKGYMLGFLPALVILIIGPLACPFLTRLLTYRLNSKECNLRVCIFWSQLRFIKTRAIFRTSELPRRQSHSNFAILEFGQCSWFAISCGLVIQSVHSLKKVRAFVRTCWLGAAAGGWTTSIRMHSDGQLSRCLMMFVWLHRQWRCLNSLSLLPYPLVPC